MSTQYGSEVGADFRETFRVPSDSGLTCWGKDPGLARINVLCPEAEGAGDIEASTWSGRQPVFTVACSPFRANADEGISPG
jgi:hypothetical protein